jgi:hypothetical protein
MIWLSSEALLDQCGAAPVQRFKADGAADISV